MGFALGLLAALPAAGRARTYPGFVPMVTDSAAVFAIPSLTEPGYLASVRDPTFGTWVLRISGDPGSAVPRLPATWQPVARHVYAKQQPWNSTGTLLSIQNRGSAESPMLLNGQTYAPVCGPCAGYDRWDYRWHPGTNHPNEQVNVNQAGTELMWYDVVHCAKTRSWSLPFVAGYGIGSGEGNPSADGRFVVIASQSAMVVVDMDPQSPGAPGYPYQRIGPVYTFPPCSLDVANPASGIIDNVSISPSGRYIDVDYAALPATGVCDTLCDMHRIFEVDTGLVIRPHAMAGGSLRCGSFAARPNGWIMPLKHADMAPDPFDNNEDVIMGGRACPGSPVGEVLKVRLRDGAVTSLTPGDNRETGYSHGSARNVTRPGWFYVTYQRDPYFDGRRYLGEIVAVRMDGSGSVQRFAHYHSTAATYDAQAQAVPSPDGRRVVFASDWEDYCAPNCDPVTDVHDLVVDARDTGPVAVQADPAPRSSLALGPVGPDPFASGPLVAFFLPSASPATLEAFDVSGRRVFHREVGALGAGAHEVRLFPDGPPAPGIYLVRLAQGSSVRSVHVVALR